MTAMIIDGKQIAQKLRADWKLRADRLNGAGIAPGLAVVMVGENAASKIYVRNKIKACREVGIRSVGHLLGGDSSQENVLGLIDRLNADAGIQGILVQLPLPAQLAPSVVIERISPDKDVDGLHPSNLGSLVSGHPRFLPCTPAGIMEMLKSTGLNLRGKEAVVVGRSNIVGKPVALLLLLVELRKRLSLSLVVLHFNHQLRGRAALEDQKFVARLAENLKLPFLVGSADVRALAKGDKANVEDAARRARYSFFAQASGEQNLDKIAVAHTADDQAETVLAHILRGSGITGLGGIHPQVGKVIRPLLSVARAELRSFLKSRRQTWREDATNRDVTKMRARIRRKLIPLLEKDFQPRVVEHLFALSAHAREDDALLERLAEKHLAECLENVPGGARVPTAALLASNFEPRAAREISNQQSLQYKDDASTAWSSRLIRRIVNKVKSTQAAQRSGELTALHVAQVLELARQGETGSSRPLPGGIVVRRHSDALVFCPA